MSMQHRSVLYRTLRTFLTGAASLGAAGFMSAGAALAQQDRPLDVPYVPTPQSVVDRMLELGEVGASDYVIDLGSGDGRIPVTAAKRYGARAMGVDLNPKRIEEARQNATENGVTDKVEFKNQNLFDTPIGEADVLTMYLLPRVNVQLRPRILSELEPGSRVVSHAFDMDDWEPDQQETVEGKTIYLWIVPAQVEGTWKLQGDTPLTLNLTQHFQKVKGTASVGGKEVALSDVSLRGKQLQFSVEGKAYEGVVDGASLSAADGGNWRATKS